MEILDASKANSLQGGPSFSLRNRVFRGVWIISWLLLASWTPPPFSSWRRLVLRLFGAKLHSTAKVYGSVKVWYPPYLEMKEYSVLGPGVNCYCMAPITIGAQAIVSQRAHLCAGTHDIQNASFQLQAYPIVIESNAWVAAEAFIGPGVTVGESAVVGARAVLFKNALAASVYVGNPAKLIRSRVGVR